MNRVRLALFSTMALGAALFAKEASQPAKPSQPTQEQVRRWVAQLGDDDFTVREEASKKLWEAGAAAEPALKEVLKDTDEEVRRRAREILDKFQWGIYPDTPREQLELIARYQSAVGEGKLAVVRDLLEGGPAGCRSLLRIAAAEPAPETRQLVRTQIARELPRALSRLLDQKEQAILEGLLAASLTADNQLGIRNAAAYWLLTGQLDKKIAQYQGLTAGKDKAREVEVLVQLLRARGDLVAARNVARRAEREDLVNALLYEATDWKEDSWPQGIAGSGRRIEQLGYQAACRRLAGQQKEFEETLAEMRKHAEEIPADNQAQLFHLAKVLLLNHQVKEGQATLARNGVYAIPLVKILLAQEKFSEALALLEKSLADNPGRADLELSKAGLLGRLGEKDKARAIFARYAGEIKKQAEAQVFWGNQLIEAEMEAGFADEALMHAVQLAIANPKRGATVFSPLFRLRGETAQNLWPLLPKLYPGEDAQGHGKRLRQLMKGTLPRQDLAALIEKSSALIKEKNPLLNPAGLHALAEVAWTCQAADLARQCLEKAGDSQALLLQGDLSACAEVG